MVKYKTISEIGTRKDNQDKVNILESSNNILMILCDGMGGHFGGQIASKITLDEFDKLFKGPLPKAKEDLVLDWFNLGIQKTLVKMTEYAKKNPNYSDMGTTLVAILIYKKEKKAFIANVGDSRAYCVDDTLIQLTKDQNYLNYLIDEKKYSFETAIKVNGWHFLMSSIGPTKQMKLDFLSLNNIDDYKYFVLTSDGVHDFIEYNEFESLLVNSGFSVKKQCEKIIEKSLKNDSNDNLSIALLRL
ncbi:PP2C family protein-serine/threonine phosphatase [Mesomycoplasma neurolyticum]|uniref:Serine/threonine phosphatase stp n=1 Tax=Mesomycoplasma neurolyticum TaxID=2120 RepID=A0A449A5M0_9BACT|nr:PP2C family serine/threonine-protein phosphatase [Mesomycoplasma neurolyticum]VEU59524.1 Serine/threonine phosphatase stp [Mesomycoplasma neurolyticum]